MATGIGFGDLVYELLLDKRLLVASPACALVWCLQTNESAESDPPLNEKVALTNEKGSSGTQKAPIRDTKSRVDERKRIVRDTKSTLRDTKSRVDERKRIVRDTKRIVRGTKSRVVEDKRISH